MPNTLFIPPDKVPRRPPEPPMAVTEEVLIEDERIRKLQDYNLRKKADELLAKGDDDLYWDIWLDDVKALGLWDEQQKAVFSRITAYYMAKIDREKARAQASESWDDIMRVYKKGLNSKDEKHAKACADALKQMIIGKDGTQPPPEDAADRTFMVVSKLPNVGDEDEE